MREEKNVHKSFSKSYLELPAKPRLFLASRHYYFLSLSKSDFAFLVGKYEKKAHNQKKQKTQEHSHKIATTALCLALGAMPISVVNLQILHVRIQAK